MGYFLLTIAIVLEVMGTTSMKFSDGFTKLLPSILIFIFYSISFVAFTYSLKYIDVSIAYAVWAGLGVFLMAAIGVIYFKDPMTILKVVSILLIIAGVIGLNAGGLHQE